MRWIWQGVQGSKTNAQLSTAWRCVFAQYVRVCAQMYVYMFKWVQARHELFVVIAGTTHNSIDSRLVRASHFESVIRTILGVTSPFFPGILLFRKPSNIQGRQLVFEKNDG